MSAPYPTLWSRMFAAGRPQVTDTCVRLEAWARLCMSVYRRSFVNGGWESPDADMQVCARLAAVLMQVLTERIATGSDPDEQCRLSVSLHALMRETDRVVDAARQSAWEALAVHSLEAYFKRLAAGCALSDVSACRLIVDYFYYTDPDDDDRWWTYLRTVVSSWSDAFIPSVGWTGIGGCEALDRLSVLNRLSYMYRYASFNRLVRDGFSFFSVLLTCDGNLSSAPSEALGRLYDLCREGNACPSDRNVCSRLAAELYRRSLSAAFDSDAWWYGLSYRVANLCG